MYHPHHHQERPDLTGCILEDRTLPASFLASTYFEPPAFSETTPMSSGMNPAIDGANSNISWGGTFSAPTNAASYYGFGSNPFGLGLSPLSGVVSAYSINSALSNIIGAGSSIPGSEQTLMGSGYQGILSSPGATVSTIESITAINDTGPTFGYGSSFSTGFSFGINSTNSYGMGPNVVGTMSAARSLYSPSPAFEFGNEPGSEPGNESEAPNGTTPNPGATQGAISPGTEASPARGEGAPSTAPAPAPTPENPHAVPPAATPENSHAVPPAATPEDSRSLMPDEPPAASREDSGAVVPEANHEDSPAPEAAAEAIQTTTPWDRALSA